MRFRVGWAACVLCAAFGSSLAADEADEASGPYAQGSLAWIASDELDLVGSMAAEVPLTTAGPWRVATSLGAVTAMEKSSTEFTFIVHRVSYTARFLARRALPGRGAIELYAGEDGVWMVDAPGHARVRIAGAAWESPGYRRAFGPSGWSGRVSAAAVIEHDGVEAVAAASGAVRYLHRFETHEAIALGFDAATEALLGRDGGADTSIGPRLEFDLGGDRRFALFARWLTSRNPLGLGSDGVLVGFDFAEGLYAGAPRAVPPEIAGLCAAGAGDGGRGLARLDLRVDSPPLLGGTFAQIEVDGNVLTAGELNDLFYLYDVGVAHPFSAWRAGVWFHHRSNHVAGGVNDTVTSINVLEAGIESYGWNRAEPSGWMGRAGALDARLRAGWLIDSAFGEDESWHARAGARWSSPTLGPSRLFVSAELERGDVAGSVYAAGALLPRGWDVRLEVRHDEQLFAADQRARLAIATLRY